jgi:hypothetical protein
MVSVLQDLQQRPGGRDFVFVFCLGAQNSLISPKAADRKPRRLLLFSTIYQRKNISHVRDYQAE